MEELLKSLEEMLKLRIMARAVYNYPKRFPEIEKELYNLGIDMEHSALVGYCNGLNAGINFITRNLRNSNDVTINEKLNDLLYVTLPEYEKSVYCEK
jgi:hypothetical protein